MELKYKHIIIKGKKILDKKKFKRIKRILKIQKDIEKLVNFNE